MSIAWFRRWGNGNRSIALNYRSLARKKRNRPTLSDRVSRPCGVVKQNETVVVVVVVAVVAVVVAVVAVVASSE